MRFPIGVPLEPSLYLQAFSRYLASNISRSRPWPFGVTWRDACRTWPFDTPYSISHSCSIVTDYLSPAVFEILGPKHIKVTTLTFQGHDLDLSRSRDVIGHVTIRFPICGFLLVFYWNRASISKRFRDIWLQIYLGHDFDLLGSRDVIGHVTIWYPI